MTDEEVHDDRERGDAQSADAESAGTARADAESADAPRADAESADAPRADAKPTGTARTDAEAAGAAGAETTSRLDTVRRSLRRTVEVLRGTSIDVEDYDPARHGPLLEAPPTELEEVERYWVDAPFSFVSIRYDAEAHRHEYHAVEPALAPDERALLEALLADVRDPLLYRAEEADDPEALLWDLVCEHLERYGAAVDARTVYRLFYYVNRDFRGYGRLEPIMHDPHVEDVSCDGYDLPIFVYHDEYADVQTSVTFGPDTLDNFVVRLAQHSGRHISIGDPMVETTLPDGSRAELALGEEVTPRGSAFTIRKYAEEPFTPVDLLAYGTFDVDQLAYLWLAIEHNKSLLIAGGTASGKTTALNALSMFIPPRSKVLTIEDTRELRLYHDNWLSAITRERLHDGSDVTMYDLLRSALRHRPEYIVVGEVRGEEAMTLFQAMNTGHTTFSTMHADSVQTVINRLENEPINVPRAMVQSLDVLAVQALSRRDDERVRRNKVIAEIEGVDGRTGELDYSTAYAWNPETDAFEGSPTHVLESIREERAWSQRDLLTELARRRTVLESLREGGVTDYRRFTGMVNEYYSDPAGVLERLGRAGVGPDAASATEDAGVDSGRGPTGPTPEPPEPER